MKIKNEYTQSLIAPSKYNPNDFTSVGVAVFYIVMLALFFAFPYVAGFLGPSRLTEYVSGDFYLNMVVSVLISQSIILLCGIGYSLIKRVNPLNGGGYVFRMDFTPMLFGCVLICGIQICFISLHLSFLESASAFAPSDSITEDMLTGNPLWVVIYLFLVPVLPCIIEEIAFRGIIMRGLNRFGGFTSVVISSAMFSLFHGNFQQIILQFLGGLAIGGCTYITGNTAQGCVMHFFNNLFAIAFAFAQALFGLLPTFTNVFTAVTVICGITMLITGLWYFVKYAENKKSEESENKYGGVLFGGPKKNIPVLMSAEYKKGDASIVIDVGQIKLFKRYYPDAMRFYKGEFISLNKETKSPTPAIILIAVGLIFAFALVVLNQFGI